MYRARAAAPIQAGRWVCKVAVVIGAQAAWHLRTALTGGPCVQALAPYTLMCSAESETHKEARPTFELQLCFIRTSLR